MPNKAAVSFDAIMQAGRERKKRQELADQIFGKSKKSNASTGNRKAAQPPSLASRIGKSTQRSSSSTNIKSKPAIQTTTNTLARGPPTRPASAAARHARENRISSAITQETGQANIRGGEAGISIRGTAGPFIVQASNFAPGTTAADIESAMVGVAGDMISCRIMSASPTVIAEIIFAEKPSADTVISTFNGQKADGRILHVYMKHSGPTKPATDLFVFDPPTGPKELLTNTATTATPSLPPSQSYNGFREEADRNRLERRRADPEVQDGRYGFESREEEPPPPPPPAKYNDRDDDRRNDSYPRDGRRDDRPRYNGGRGGGGGGRGYSRNGGSFRRNDDRRSLYSDEIMIDPPERSRTDTRDRPRGYR